MTAHRNALTLLAMMVTLTFTPALHASPPPTTAERVDRNAPCYRWPAVDWDGDGIFDRVDHCNDTPKGCVVDALGCSIDGDGDGVCDGLDRCPNTPPGNEVDRHGCADDERQVSRTPAAPEPPREVEKPRPMTRTEKQLVETGRIRLENLYFESNSAALLPESEATLRDVGETLEKFPNLRIEVEGHTDTRGGAGYNRRLSEVRAETVRLWLLEHFKLDPRNYTSRGYGESRPETRERNEEELVRNRRVVLTVQNPEVLPRGVRVEQKP